jgi:hypothetical protein
MLFVSRGETVGWESIENAVKTSSVAILLFEGGDVGTFLGGCIAGETGATGAAAAPCPVDSGTRDEGIAGLVVVIGTVSGFGGDF